MSTGELRVINPFTEQVELSVPMIPLAEVDAVVDRARDAFLLWRSVSIDERIALCKRFVVAFREMGDEIALNTSRQMGKPVKQALGEVNRLCERAEYMIGIARDTLADEPVPEIAGFRRYVRHEPLGVVFDIAAWNYPLLIAVNVVVPAVLAGNAVILKHSSRTPLCGQAFEDAFKKAGAPDNLVQHVVCEHSVAEAFVKHAGVDYVSFTGSTRGGHDMVRAASGRFINVGLELGGKDPAYVCADADFKSAVENCVDGAFYNAGQSCCAIERIYVEKSIYKDFVEAYVEETKKYIVPGDPKDPATSMGPMAMRPVAAFLARQVDDAIRAGGELVVSGRDFSMPEHGWFASPAVVADAPQTCTLMQEESFGPVIGIAPVDSDQQAIRYMNDSAYGLTASIWTKDIDRAVRVGEQVETGTFFLNRCDYCDPGLPWTGLKDTGRGASLSKYGFYQLTRLKSMHLRVP
ncbi:MAG TPA: aldehyde dehydrogenase family protein [Candidatus Hydrogenedentes bacterium]|nr:aldehyde dehydrogenase family protein [Candidatus Hydrogenedentota bacterium]